MYTITNSEYSILVILAELKTCSGYEINNVIQERGFQEWADIGTTSIYNGLKKMEKKGLVESRIDLEKSGKGPVGYKYTVTSDGYNLLITETKTALSKSRERERFFALGIAGSFCINRNEFVTCLNNRLDMLKNEQKRIRSIVQQHDNLNLQAKLLFEYTFHQIKSEIKYTTETINKIKEAGYDD
jgi:DNA-binding PadR family transcriptional regulator